MPRIYKLSRTGLKLLYKIRHHRGHGVHSPFVFNLINKVIEEKTSYYAYNDIAAYLNSFPDVAYKSKKFNRLSFRLVNYFNSKTIMEIGSGRGFNTLYLTVPSSKIECICIEPDPDKRLFAQKLYNDFDRKIELYDDIPLNINRKIDCLFIDLKADSTIFDKNINYLLNLLHDKSFIVVEGIRLNKNYRKVWERIAAVEGRTVVLDLFSVGIVFFDKKLYRWNYKISY
jgi:predicted O-methyltransferase YrrM